MKVKIKLLNKKHERLSSWLLDKQRFLTLATKSFDQKGNIDKLNFSEMNNLCTTKALRERENAAHFIREDIYNIYDKGLI